jgi:hypothetical protein
MSRGLLYFHQGWEDILLCLPLINYYASRYTRLVVLVREDARNLVQFYARGLRNVSCVFASLDELNKKGVGAIGPLKDSITSYELIGQLDGGRTDKYKNAHRLKDYSLDKMFYEPYDITSAQRLDAFAFYRDPIQEEVSYNAAVKTSGSYICVHDVPLENKFTCVDTTLPIIRLSSTMFFDAIRILQHAKEIHLVDSTWAIICYLMDAKYGLFHQIPVHVYCFDNRESMVSDPVHLPNWTIHSSEESRANRHKTGAAIVSFANGGYAEQQALLVDSVYKHSPSIPIFPYNSFEQFDSPPHGTNPYAFKVYAIEAVRKMGYPIVLWCDSVLRLTKPVQTLLPDIHTVGVYLQQDGWNVAQWANDRALQYFGVTRDEAESITAVYACFMAYDFSVPITQEFFQRWKKACDDGIFKGGWKNENNSESRDPRCRGHRHDQSCAELISHQLGIPRSTMRVLPGRDASERYFTTWKHL